MVSPPIIDPFVEYFTISPDSNSWFEILIWFIEVLIPDTELKIVFFLFWYPEPEFSILTDPKMDFLLKDLNSWSPIPCEVKLTVLIPDIASPKVLCNLTVVDDCTETKYEESVDNPPTPLCPLVS